MVTDKQMRNIGIQETWTINGMIQQKVRSRVGLRMGLLFNWSSMLLLKLPVLMHSCYTLCTFLFSRMIVTLNNVCNLIIVNDKNSYIPSLTIIVGYTKHQCVHTQHPCPRPPTREGYKYQQKLYRACSFSHRSLLV